MPSPARLSLETARLRAAAAYELVLYDRLDDGERSLFAELAAEPGFYGVLRPTAAAGGHRYRAVDRDTALLLLTLAQPGPPPFFARGPESARGLVELVLDGVLEVEHEGSFVSGAAAAPLLAAPEEAVSDHVLARLSRRALRLAMALRTDDASRLALFLYEFNRRALTPEWDRLLPDREAVLDHLGLAPRGGRRGTWEIADRGEGPGGWIHLQARGRRPGAEGATYKLYVSPRTEDLPAAFDALLGVLGESRHAALKVGADAAGLLRPDKLIAYFGDLESLLAAARGLEERVAGLVAHGVPFTAPIDRHGLLSWGVDPPAAARPLSWQGPESWRTWLVGRLAAALARAGDVDAEEGCSYALARLAHEGVDVQRWLPGAGLFRAA